MLKHIFLLATFSLMLSAYAQRIDTIKVKVHDHDMVLYVSGIGKPAVVLEAGLGASHKAWLKVDSAISNTTRVVSYDRPGYLRSDTCSKPRDAITIAKELKEALTKAKIQPPYILAGWSLGGAFVRVFAGMYPNDVAGLVLVDPAPEDVYARYEKEHPELLADDSAYTRQVIASNRHGEKGELIAFDSSMDQARRSDAQHATPTVLLIAAGKAPGGQDRDPSNPLNKIWIEELEKWAKKRPNLKYTIIRTSGHHIAGDQPVIVVQAIHELIKQ